jgi:hypothetical protein
MKTNKGREVRRTRMLWTLALVTGLAAGAGAQSAGPAQATFSGSKQNAENQPVTVILQGSPLPADKVPGVDIEAPSASSAAASAAEPGAAKDNSFDFEVDSKSGRVYDSGAGKGLPLSMRWKSKGRAIRNAKLLGAPELKDMDEEIAKAPEAVYTIVVPGSAKLLGTGGEQVTVVTIEIVVVDGGQNRKLRMAIGSDGRKTLMDGPDALQKP